MLRSVGVGRGRWGAVLALISIAATVAITTPAEARRKKFHRRAHVAAGGGYNPPFAAMVVDANTGRTMYAVDENEPRHPASITKVMTLYMLFEQLDRGALSLDSELRVSSRAALQAPSKIGVRPGDTIAVEDAIKALVTKSANDVAVVIAENIAGSEEDFAERMTRRARQLGMSGTVYRNASGLPNPEQITTARDLTILARAIQDRFPRYYKFFQTRSFAWEGRVIGNHNRLLGRVEGVDGIKTGFTNKSGFNLMTSARIDGRHVVGIVLGGKSGASRDNIMANLIRTNLAKASTGPSNTRYADAGRDVETTAATSKPLDLAALRPAASPSARPGAVQVPPTAMAYASVDTREDARPVPPSTAQKIEARMPATAAVPVRVEPPARPEPSGRAEKASDADYARPARVSSWVIQLGAAEEEKEARAILDDAKTRSGRLLANAAPFTERVQRSGATLYRARFSGFAEADTAQDACRTLKSRGFACFATRS